MTSNYNIAFKEYPNFVNPTPQEVKEQLRQIVNLRKDDITTISQLPQVFVLGRKVGKIPTDSADVVPEDKVGDFNVDASFAYYLIDNAGSPEWRRVAVGAF